MIARVWDRAMASSAEEVVVATDDERIVAEVERCGGQAMMTSADHACGTDRLAEVVDTLGWPKETVVVNLQGDEPCIPVELIDKVAQALLDCPEAGIATMATGITEPEELFSTNAVKVVLNEKGMASYFSRAPIPWVRSHFKLGSVPESLPSEPTFLRHLGMYAYRAGVLQNLASHQPSPCEQAESLEQLRALAMGISIHVSCIANAPAPGVDTEEDLARAEREFSA